MIKTLHVLDQLYTLNALELEVLPLQKNEFLLEIH